LKQIKVDIVDTELKEVAGFIINAAYRGVILSLYLNRSGMVLKSNAG
jgi:hypothetical protein